MARNRNKVDNTFNGNFVWNEKPDIKRKKVSGQNKRKNEKDKIRKLVSQYL